MSPAKHAHSTVAVTGAGGFIGRALVASWAGEDTLVKGLLGPAKDVFDSAPSSAQADLVHGDIADGLALERLVDGADTVFHLAGLASVADSFRRPKDHLRVHYHGTKSLLAACTSSRVRRVVYASSAEVYGRPAQNPVNEHHPRAPTSPYGVAKVAAEDCLLAWGENHQVEVVILRPFLVFGPRLRDTSVVGDLLSQAISAPIVRPYTTAPIRDLCYIDDVVAAFRLAGSRPLLSPQRTFNIGSGMGTSVGELAARMIEVVGRDVPVVARDDRDRPTHHDIPCLVADATRAEAELGWRAETSLIDGLRRTLAHLRAATARHDA